MEIETPPNTQPCQKLDGKRCRRVIVHTREGKGKGKRGAGFEDGRR